MKVSILICHSIYNNPYGAVTNIVDVFKSIESASKQLMIKANQCADCYGEDENFMVEKYVHKLPNERVARECTVAVFRDGKSLCEHKYFVIEWEVQK